MSITKEVWISLLENAPAACTEALSEVALKGDLDSIDNAVDAGVPGAGPDTVKLDRICVMARGFNSEARSDRPFSEATAHRKATVLERYLSCIGNITVLDAALSLMVRGEHMDAVAALMRSGASPYRYASLDSIDAAVDASKKPVNAATRYLDLGAMSATLLYTDLFGWEPITHSAQLPREIPISSGDSEIDCNLLEAAVIKHHYAIARRVRERIVRGSEAETLYLEMGDQVLRLLGFPVDGALGPAGMAALTPMSSHNQAIGSALRLIANGARMRSQAQWENVLWREVGDHASPLFAALQPYQPQPDMHMYDLSRQDMCEVFSACLEAGLDVNRLNKRGGTFLIDAAWQGNTRLVEMLLLAGADTRPTISGPDGPYTALDFALEKDNKTIINMLRAAQARQAIMSVTDRVRNRPE